MVEARDSWSSQKLRDAPAAVRVCARWTRGSVGVCAAARSDDGHDDSREKSDGCGNRTGLIYELRVTRSNPIDGSNTGGRTVRNCGRKGPKRSYWNCETVFGQQCSLPDGKSVQTKISGSWNRPKSLKGTERRLFSLLAVLVLLLGTTTTRSEAAWRFLSETRNFTNLSSRLLCSSIPGLVRRQRLLCERNTDLMVAVAEGVLLGVKECQFQFRNSKWNCSGFSHASLDFGRHILRNAADGTRESSFIHAIHSAAVVYAITRACNKGELLHCECDPSKKGSHSDKRGQFTWGGCSDNIRFSSSFARKFIDASEKRQRDLKSTVILHNNRVGRKSIRKKVQLQCKCHGVSGSCSYRTCWLTMSKFRGTSGWLKKRYKKAVQVTAKPDGLGLLPKIKQKLRKADLVYLETSPDYCTVNPRKGVLGTGGRRCNATSTRSDGCSSLCCGRGFYSEKKIVTSRCGCNFKWCCYVSCNTCEKLQTFHYCNPPFK